MTTTSAEITRGDYAFVTRTMHALLRGELSSEQAGALLEVPPPRLEIYRRFVQLHVRTILEKNFPVVRALLEGPVWDELVDGYFAERPLRHYELNRNAAGFPAFLHERVSAGVRGPTAFHAELAEVEWREWVAYSQQVSMPAALPGQLVALNPTLSVLELEYPVASYLTARRRGVAGLVVPGRSPEIALVWRHPVTHRVVLAVADDGLLFAIKVAHDGLRVGEAAAASGATDEQAEGVLGRAAQLGLIIR